MSPQQANQLLQNGISKWSRNPMYVGMALLLFALALLLDNMISLLGVL